MEKKPNSLIQELIEYPSFLFLGQSYLKTDGEEDLFLKSIAEKYLEDSASDELQEEKGYDLIFDTDIAEHIDESFSWMFQLSKRLTPPKNFESVTEIPWSAVYTSSIDTILIDAFQNDWRQPQPVYNSEQITSDPRNRFELHINYLFGCINQAEENNRVPLSHLKKKTRLNRANSWILKIPELLTTRGKLCIEGYNPEKDWLKIDVLYSVIDSLEEQQVYFFNFQEEYRENEFIDDLIQKNKIVPVNSSLSTYIGQYLQEEDIDVSQVEKDSLYGKWVNIRGKRKRVPKELKSRLIKSAVILDDTLTLPRKIDSQEERYLEFKRFLSAGSNQPDWKGYGNDFAFKRSFVVEILRYIKSQLESNTQTDEPIINYGQSSSGKTIGLGHVGYYLATELRYPVLFIPRNFRSPDETDLDIFCEWAENNGTDFTIIIWDGMIESGNYYKLLKRLNARGRKIILIGSSYKKNDESSKENYKKQNFIEANIELNNEEQERLRKYLDENLSDNQFLEDIMRRSGAKNFLAILYRFLPQTKMNIQEGLTTEVNKFSEFIIDNATKTTNYKPQTRFAELLNDAGLVDEIDLKQEVKVENETLDIREQFIQYIMIPGQFGLSVPFELLLRCLGAEALNSSLFEQLRKTDIVKWSEDKIGNIFIGPRTAIEGEIISNSLGSLRAKIEVIKNLIKYIKADQNRVQANSRKDPVEVDFAVELLQQISPNSDSNFKNEYLLEITDVLEDLRLSKKAYHPRLVLQEASYLREIAKDDEFSSEELLAKSEELLHDEIEKLENESFSNIKTYFQVELASTLGSKVYKLLNEDSIHKDEVLKYYNMAKQEVLSSKEENPENYPALDVLLWTTRDLVNSNILADDELAEIEMDLFHLIDFVEQEGIGENYKEKFRERKLEIGEALDKKVISEAAFQKLEEQGSAAGYYIRARNKLGSDTSINMSEIPTTDQLGKLQSAYNYLDENYDKISEDGRSVYFMFRLWWLIKAQKPLFYKEKLTIPFSESNWQKCLEFTLHLTSLDSLYETPTLLYQRALSFFHLGHYKRAMDTFDRISSMSDYSTVYGSRRIKKYHLASNEDGSLKKFSGEAAYNIKRSDKQRKGHIFVNEIRDRVPFMLNDFKIREITKGRRFNDLAIAFNFRGPIAIPSNFMKE